MPYRLVYSSAATPDLTAAALEKLLERARVRNRARDITGGLVFVDGVFLQILEGEKEVVLGLVKRITLDPRHSRLKVFHEHEIDERAFPSWSMALVSPSADQVSQWAQLEGATTIGEVLSSIENEPDRLPALIRNILKVIAEY